ncbi:serine protease inhibitor dipetalogastin-like [Anastrepha ludens]|uniref:serine protease inhibitor dipetalogastin-like n=1 Tax=Anastrepha ludens TaxID=28586 RepID=UPI0023B02164|nr:serine protease inhibitor dipetalogastin-like [Anastrepha ludens]
MHFSQKFSISLLVMLSCVVYQSYASISAEAAPVDAAEELCMCGRQYSPVCGSDLTTYNNPCLFECARKKLAAKGRSLTQARSGACDTMARSLAEVTADEEAEADDDTDLAACACDRSLAPVCGSDNRTYSNRCIFECKRSILARLGRVLTILREGACK